MSTAASHFTPDSKLGDIVAAQPALARVFERLGLDYCCGGKQTLASACSKKQLDPRTVAVMLEVAAATARSGPVEVVDAASLTLTELADHIEQTHHTYLKAELPRLVEMSERVARKHGWRDARLAEVHDCVTALTEEMLAHMHKEEAVLFPIIRQIEAGVASAGAHCGSVANPIRQMEMEHESAGTLTARLRELTDGFTSTPESCNTHRAMLAGLAEFESDLHRHVHKENNILFPRALALANVN
jgi:regulator of cell morphogenesis and NO signaling